MLKLSIAGLRRACLSRCSFASYNSYLPTVKNLNQITRFRLTCFKFLQQRMKLLKVLFLVCFSFQCFAQNFSSKEVAKWQRQANQVKIIRDQWGVPHIYGKTDADAVFGLLYAQCEDDFARVEMNYIEKLGRLAEVNGESKLFDDLLIRLVIDSVDAVADFKKAPAYLKKLMHAYADGINYFLHTHPEIKPALLKRFQPWYPLLWTDGSIGAISTSDITMREMTNLYSRSLTVGSLVEPIVEEKLTGSNGFAFAPSVSETGNAMLYINPHVTFYFRPEVHMVSEEGLNVYGAVTWGQFFIYQGFNEHCGWMHTSSQTDIADSYIEKIKKEKNQWYYEYNGKKRKVVQKKIRLQYAEGNEKKTREFDALYTHHGPVMALRNDQYLSLKANNRSLTGLIQSWERTKAKSFDAYKKTMDLLANTSNNTVYADAEGNIAYWHGNFIPIRNPTLDWSKPVDGSTSTTEWKGFHPVKESVHVYNPPNGWLQNCNSTPYTVAGKFSPKKENYPAYMAPDDENFRGINAVRVLSATEKYSLDAVIEAGYNTYLTSFEMMTPLLVKAFEKGTSPGDSLHVRLKEPIDVLKGWDYHTGLNSVATTLAVEWGQRLIPSINKLRTAEKISFIAAVEKYLTTAPPHDILVPFSAAVKDIATKFGDWRIGWGDINRFQRLTGDLVAHYDDKNPSLAVPYVSSLWGMLPSYASSYFPGTQKRYGTGGNSFICVVEFGKRIKAKSLLAGGQSGDPSSPHFTDQALMYTQGKFKDVLFYKEDVEQNAREQYNPGKR